MELHGAIQDFAEELLPQQVLLSLLKDYRRPHDKINELVKQGMLVKLKRELYVPGPGLNIARPESFLIANHLWGPSYVSLESALSYHGYIPERVHETSSVTVKRTRDYKTPAGRFSYLHLPLPYYAFGIQSVSLTPRQFAMIASIEKALCDKIVLTSGILLRSVQQTLAFLTEDLRIDEESLSQINCAQIATWIADAPKSSSLEMLIKTLDSL